MSRKTLSKEWGALWASGGRTFQERNSRPCGRQQLGLSTTEKVTQPCLRMLALDHTVT